MENQGAPGAEFKKGSKTFITTSRGSPSGFAQGGGGFQPYPPPVVAGVDPPNLLVLNLTVEIHSTVNLGLLKSSWPSDHF